MSLFSVNRSGNFCGVAQLLSDVETKDIPEHWGAKSPGVVRVSLIAAGGAAVFQP